MMMMAWPEILLRGIGIPKTGLLRVNHPHHQLSMWTVLMWITGANDYVDNVSFVQNNNIRITWDKAATRIFHIYLSTNLLYETLPTGFPPNTHHCNGCGGSRCAFYRNRVIGSSDVLDTHPCPSKRISWSLVGCSCAHPRYRMLCALKMMVCRSDAISF